MRKLTLSLVLVGTLAGGARAASAAYYVEYYRDNLFLGLAYHRVGCLTDWNTIQSDQDYDGFTGQRYCNAGASPESVPGRAGTATTTSVSRSRWWATRCPPTSSSPTTTSSLTFTFLITS